MPENAIHIAALGLQPAFSPSKNLKGSLRSTGATSEAWFKRAKKALAGGVSSSARMVSGGSGTPLYLDHGRGSHVWNVDGVEFIDCLLSYGSIILGHADAGLENTIAEQLRRGSMFGTCNTVEVELAEQICRMVPSAQLVRFANSGSEAISGAIRAARGYTGRDKIVKFEGHYHGWMDVLAISNRPSEAEAGPLAQPRSLPHSRGVPAGVVADVIICPWNEPQTLRDCLDAHPDEIAAVICEPIVANNACMMPQPHYLEALADECRRRGILLIFDEIVTGFRVRPGGAQELFGVLPDLTVFSKALGGGLPLSAFCGSREVMEPIAANTVKHGGTYNGNPLCAAAALHTLRAVSKPGALEAVEHRGGRLMAAIRSAATEFRVPCHVQGVGSMFQVVFADHPGPLRHYRDLLRVDAGRFARFRQALLSEGVLVNNSGLACWFLSLAHDDDDIDFILAAIPRAMRSAATGET